MPEQTGNMPEREVELPGVGDAPPSARPLTWAVAALGFLIVFAIYAAPSSLFIQRLYPVFGGLSREPPLDTIAPVGVQLTIYWSALALVAMVLSVFATIWSIGALRAMLPRQWPGIAAFLLLATIAAAAISGRTPPTLVSVSSALTCSSTPMVRSAPGFLCSQMPDGPAYRAGVHRAQPSTGPRSWISAVLAFRQWLNNVFQAAAIFIIGTMIAIHAPCRELRNGAYVSSKARRRTSFMLFALAGAILSTITLTDIVFVNWPISTVRDVAAAKGMITILTSLIFFYAVLGSLTLASGLLVARMVGGVPLSLFSSEPGIPRGVLRVRKLIFSPAAIRVLVALSPVLTTAIGTPLVQEVLKALDATGPDRS